MMIVTAWIACGVFNTGVTFRYYQDEYPQVACEQYREQLGAAVVPGVFGPLWSLPVLLMSGFAEHGWGFESKHCE